MSADSKKRAGREVYDFLTNPMWSLSGKVVTCGFIILSLMSLPSLLYSAWATIDLLTEVKEMDIFGELPGYFGPLACGVMGLIIFFTVYFADWAVVKAKKEEKKEEKFAKTYLAAIIIGAIGCALIAGLGLQNFGYLIFDEPLEMQTAVLVCFVATLIVAVFLDRTFLHKSADGIFAWLAAKAKEAGITSVQAAIALVRTCGRANPGVAITQLIANMRAVGDLPAEVKDEEILNGLSKSNNGGN